MIVLLLFQTKLLYHILFFFSLNNEISKIVSIQSRLHFFHIQSQFDELIVFIRQILFFILIPQFRPLDKDSSSQSRFMLKIIPYFLDPGADRPAPHPRGPAIPDTLKKYNVYSMTCQCND